MFLPNSRIWKRLGDEWLVSQRAAIIFAASGAFILAGTLLLYVGLPPIDTFSPLSIVAGIVGFICPFAMVFLWGGMLRFWMGGEPSDLTARRVWFVVLILGLFYGAIFYYLAVYLPSSRKRRSLLET